LVTLGLEGFTVGVTADRRGDDQAVLLGRLGVEVVRGPVLRTELDPVDDDLRAATDRIIADPPDVLVANTGFGIRSWWARAAVWGIQDELTAALAETRLVARGPKAAGALRSLGLPVWWRSPTEQLDSVADHLIEGGVAGADVALQLHGDDNQTLSRRLGAAGASVREVPVYRWALPSDDRAALALIRRCCEGSVDAVTFTAGPAVRQFLDLAEAEGLAEPLLAALNGPMIVVCVGPVCAGVAHEEGIVAPVVPEHWRLGAMVKLVGTALAGRAWHVPAPSTPSAPSTPDDPSAPDDSSADSSDPTGDGKTVTIGKSVTIRGGRLLGPGGTEVLAPPGRLALALLIAQGGGPVRLPSGVDALRAAVPALAGALSEDADGVRLAGWPDPPVLPAEALPPQPPHLRPPDPQADVPVAQTT
jgi:uroporphyrinogen-III synthase